MKSKVLITILIVTILLCLILFGIDRPYKFRQEYDQIVKIEITQKEQDISGYEVPKKVLKVLKPSEHRAFIDDLKKVDGSYVGMDPPDGFGMYIIRITYRNGEVELISEHNNGYISVDGIIYEGVYCMNKDQFYDFLSRVLGERITG